MPDPTVLVTGGARRIGAAICRAFHARGYSILIHYNRSATAAAELAEQLNHERPASAAAIPCDLSATSAIAGFVERSLGTFGRIDLLINNASLFYPTPAGSLSAQDIERLMTVNYTTPALLATHLADQVSSVINMADIFGEQPLANYAAYSASKAALIMLTRSLALELAPVRVNAISPGAILWPAEDDDWSEQTRAAFLQRVPLGHLGGEDAIVQAAIFLATNDYVTGAILKVDGGRSLT